MTAVCPLCVLSDVDGRWIGEAVRGTGVLKCPFCRHMYIAHFDSDRGYAQALHEAAAINWAICRLYDDATAAPPSNGLADEAHRPAGLGDALAAGLRMVRAAVAKPHGEEGVPPSNGLADEAHRGAGLGSNSHEQPAALTEPVHVVTFDGRTEIYGK